MERLEFSKIPFKKALGGFALASVAGLAFHLAPNVTFHPKHDPEVSELTVKRLADYTAEEQQAVLLDFDRPKANEIKLPQLCEDPDLVWPLHPEWDYHPNFQKEEPIVLPPLKLSSTRHGSC